MTTAAIAGRDERPRRTVHGRLGSPGWGVAAAGAPRREPTDYAGDRPSNRGDRDDPDLPHHPACPARGPIGLADGRRDLPEQRARMRRTGIPNPHLSAQGRNACIAQHGGAGLAMGLALAAGGVAAGQDDATPTPAAVERAHQLFNGTWQVVELTDNGETLGLDLVRAKLARDGRVRFADRAW